MVVTVGDVYVVVVVVVEGPWADEGNGRAWSFWRFSIVQLQRRAWRRKDAAHEHQVAGDGIKARLPLGQLAANPAATGYWLSQQSARESASASLVRKGQER